MTYGAVYGDLDAPLFKAADVADLVEYGEGNVWNLVRLCEEDEHMLLPLVVAGQKRQVTFITETGLFALSRVIEIFFLSHFSIKKQFLF